MTPASHDWNLGIAVFNIPAWSAHQETKVAHQFAPSALPVYHWRYLSPPFLPATLILSLTAIVTKLSIVSVVSIVFGESSCSSSDAPINMKELIRIIKNNNDEQQEPIIIFFEFFFIIQ